MMKYYVRNYFSIKQEFLFFVFLELEGLVQNTWVVVTLQYHDVALTACRYAFLMDCKIDCRNSVALSKSLQFQNPSVLIQETSSHCAITGNFRSNGRTVLRTGGPRLLVSLGYTWRKMGHSPSKGQPWKQKQRRTRLKDNSWPTP